MSSQTKVVRPISARPTHTTFSILNRTKQSFLAFFLILATLASLPLSTRALSVDELDLIPPHSPMNFTAESGDESTLLTWTSIDPTEVDQYKVYVRTATMQLDPIFTKEQQVTVPNLTNGTMYFFSITALDTSNNESERSNEIGVTPSKIQTITQKKYTVAAWMSTSFDGPDSIKALDNNLDVFDIISPFWYDLNPDGTLSPKGGAQNAEFVTHVQSNGIKVVPSITNNFSSVKAATALKSPGSILNHIDFIVKEVMDRKYDGIDIDYENVATDQKDLFSFFMRNLAEQLHERGKILTITSQPKLSDNYNWNGPGAIDWQVAGEAADYVRIMNYDFSRANTPPGPIAPKEWLAKSMEYALTVIPADKILGGIPFYGYDWALGVNGITSGLVWDGVQNTLSKYPETKVQRDDASGEGWYEYNDITDGPRKAYFNDAKSIEQKLQVIAKQGVGGITIWRLGSEDPANFDMIRKYLGKQGVLYSPADVKIIPKNHSIKLQWAPNTNSSNAIGNYIYQGTTPENMKRVATVQGAVEKIITGLSNEKAYYFKVTTFNARGKESDASNIFLARPTNLVTVSPINNLTVSHTTTSDILLNWKYQDDPNFTGNILGYDIRYSKEPISQANWQDATRLPSKNIHFGAEGVLTYNVTDLTPDTSYSFGIKTIDELQQTSALSNVVTAKTQDLSSPSTPTHITLKKSTRGVLVSWTGVPDFDLAGYALYYQGSDGILRSIFVGLNTEYDLDFLNEKSIYTIYIVAVDHAGNESSPTESRKVLQSEL